MMAKEIVDLGLEEVEVVAAGERKPWLATCPRGRQKVTVAAVPAVLTVMAALGHMVMMGPLVLWEEVEGLE